MIEFFKFHGAGNDFIMIDNRLPVFQGDKIEFAKKICSRRFGVGSDGIIFMENWSEGDFNMDFYNPDGSQSFCGNGSRCAVAFAKKLGMIESKAKFLAVDGVHEAKIENEIFCIHMGDVESFARLEKDFIIDTGSPHYISTVTNLENKDLLATGRAVRFSDPFKEKGINVNLIEKDAERSFRIRTYERGVEDETLACGTGATAAALAFAEENDLADGRIEVKAMGGNLSVDYNREGNGFRNIWLNGPAVEVYKGEFNV
ncbi:MAG: diaminopimelate epimerase [Arenicella sp.]|jgi:diaminopimelate epimerase